MKIRRAKPTDALSIAKVQVNSWKTTYKNIIPDSYLNQMSDENRAKKWQNIISTQSVFVAENVNREIVGFSNGGKERTGQYPDYKGEIYAIYILKQYQCKGLGKLLLEPIIKDLMDSNIYSMLVLVLEENSSRYFYEKLGAKKMDTMEIEISGKKLNEWIYGWKDIRKII